MKSTTQIILVAALVIISSIFGLYFSGIMPNLRGPIEYLANSLDKSRQSLFKPGILATVCNSEEINNSINESIKEIITKEVNKDLLTARAGEADVLLFKSIALKGILENIELIFHGIEEVKKPTSTINRIYCKGEVSFVSDSIDIDHVKVEYRIDKLDDGSYKTLTTLYNVGAILRRLGY